MERNKRKASREMTYTLCTFDILMGDINKENCLSLAHTCGLSSAVFIMRFWPRKRYKL